MKWFPVTRRTTKSIQANNGNQMKTLERTNITMFLTLACLNIAESLINNSTTPLQKGMANKRILTIRL